MGKNKEMYQVYSSQIIERGENYLENVKSCIKIGDCLHAEVQGSYLYKTKVNLLTLEGECSCPYEYNCKHAVAAYLYYKKGKGGDAAKFLNHLKALSKEELIKLVESLLPKNPEIIKKYSFRAKTDFNQYVADLINDFSVDEMENVKNNLDCLNFGQLLEILDYTVENEDSINEEIAQDYDSDYEGDDLIDFQFDIKDEIIKRISSKEQLLAVLKKGYMNDEIARNAEQLFGYKDLIKQYLSKEQYIWFLLKSNNPDLAEVKEYIKSNNWRYVLGLLSQNIALAEKLAEYLNNDDLRFLVAYHKDDSKRIIQHFSIFDKMEQYYMANAENITTILRKSKDIPEKIAVRLFRKKYFAGYSERTIRFLTANISDRDLIAVNLDFSAEFSKIKEAIPRLEELEYDTKILFMKNKIFERKHWTEIVEIIRFARKSFGCEFAKKLIMQNKEQFITSSTLKCNLKKERIVIQNVKGEMRVEVGVAR